MHVGECPWKWSHLLATHVKHGSDHGLASFCLCLPRYSSRRSSNTVGGTTCLTRGLIDTELTPNALYRELKPFLQQRDYLFITRLDRERQGWLPEKAWAWIRRHER